MFLMMQCTIICFVLLSRKLQIQKFRIDVLRAHNGMSFIYIYNNINKSNFKF